MDGLLLRGEPVRGKVGQPSVPMSLNPDGVYSIGLKIGRRSADLVLMDFLGESAKPVCINTYRLSDARSASWNLPTSGYEDADRHISAEVSASASPALALQHHLNCGTGPMKLGRRSPRWMLGAGLTCRRKLPRFRPILYSLQNDATSACGAELVFGAGTRFPDFIYFFIGSFIGGGVVLNSSLLLGTHRNCRRNRAHAGARRQRRHAPAD